MCGVQGEVQGEAPEPPGLPVLQETVACPMQSAKVLGVGI